MKVVSVRVNQLTGCFKNNAILQSSRQDRIIYIWLKHYITDLEYKYKINKNGSEFDAYSKKFNIAIEYDGRHNDEKSKLRDEEKNRFCIENNIKLIRVREEDTIKINTDVIQVIYCNYDKDLNYMKDVIKNLEVKILNMFNFNRIDININNIINEVIKTFVGDMQSKYSLANKYPAIAKGLIGEYKEKAKILKAKSSLVKLLYKCECGNVIKKYPKNLVITKCRCNKYKRIIKFLL